MKMPGLKFDKASIMDGLLNHGEKVVVVIVGILGLVLAWNGLSALRTKSVSTDATPKAVSDLTSTALRHIDEMEKPPAESVPSTPTLTKMLDPWRPSQLKLADPPSMAVLDRPLVQASAKRGTPEILPIEDLQAVAGVAMLADLTDPTLMPGRGPAPDRPEPEAPTRPGQRGRQPPRRGTEEPPPDWTMQPEPMLGDRGKAMPYVLLTGLVPVDKQRAAYERAFGASGMRDPQLDLPHWSQYIVERAAAGTERWQRLKIVNVDSYSQEAGMMSTQPGRAADSMQAMQQDPIPPTFLLGGGETDIGYVAQLPQRIDEPWGLEAIHPWFRAKLRRLLSDTLPGATGVEAASKPVSIKQLESLNPRKPDEFANQLWSISGMKLTSQPQRDEAVPTIAVVSAAAVDGSAAFATSQLGMTEKVIFVMSPEWARTITLYNELKVDTPCTLRVRMEMVGTTPIAHILGIAYDTGSDEAADELADPAPFPLGGDMVSMPGEMGMGGGYREGAEMAGGTEYRLFRFLDTDVTPGQRYRYRVRLSLHNPNFGLDRRQLDDPASAKSELVASAPSNETPPVVIPDAKTLLVRTLTRDRIKELKVKADVYEVLVMAPAEQTGNFALGFTDVELGSAANVTKTPEKPTTGRPRPDKVVDPRTNRDTVETNRVLADVRGSQVEPVEGAPPVEPFEMLFVRPDGTAEVVSAAESQRFWERYLFTLETPEQTGLEGFQMDFQPPRGR